LVKTDPPAGQAGTSGSGTGAEKHSFKKKQKKLKIRVAKATAFVFSCPDIAEIDLIPGDIAL